MVDIRDINYAQYCGNRLPCGYCRIIMAMCPLHVQTITTTWDTTPITTTTTTASTIVEEKTNNG